MSKYRIVLYHFVAWAIFYTLPFLSIWSSSAAEVKLPSPPSLFWFSSVLQILLFYLNAYWLMPRFFFKQQYLSYALGVLGLLVARGGILSLVPFPDMAFMGQPPLPEASALNMQRFFLFFPGFITIVLSSGFRVIVEHNRKEQLYKERENTHLRSELRFLRSQISPHFLFNVLNSLTALARKKSDLLEPSLLKLSELMRYTIYETEQDFITLESEVEYIQSYINLQKLRFEENIRLNINIEKEGFRDLQIAPMMLIPLIENAFKYSTQVVESPYIELNLGINSQQHLVLNLKNSCTNAPVYSFDENAKTSTGLGLSNLQRRLELIYPQRFLFQAQRMGTAFLVILEIDLNVDIQINSAQKTTAAK